MLQDKIRSYNVLEDPTDIMLHTMVFSLSRRRSDGLRDSHKTNCGGHRDLSTQEELQTVLAGLYAVAAVANITLQLLQGQTIVLTGYSTASPWGIYGGSVIIQCTSRCV